MFFKSFSIINHFAVLGAFAASTLFAADGIAPFAKDEELEDISCSYLCFAQSMNPRKTNISLVKNEYRIEFENEKLGKLSDFLEPLGVDPRIILNYYKWNIVSSVPKADCKVKTFGSLYPEQLECDTEGAEFRVRAVYRNENGVNMQDDYIIDKARIKLSTKTVKSKDWCYSSKSEDALRIQLEYTYPVRDSKKTHTVKRQFVYAADQSHSSMGEGPGYIHLGSCSVSTLKGHYTLGLKKLIELRK